MTGLSRKLLQCVSITGNGKSRLRSIGDTTDRWYVVESLIETFNRGDKY